MPATVARGMLVNEFGRVWAVTSLPPTMRMSMPRMMYSVARVTTRLGTRPTATIRPLAIPQASPMPRPMRKTRGVGMPGRVPDNRARQVGRQAEYRADRQVHVPADHDHGLAQREQRVDRGV